MIGILFLLLMVVSTAAILTSVSIAKDIKSITGGTTTGIPPCPPHKWQDIEFKDQFGETRYTNRCDKCKKLVSEIG